jgi:hypothetical protein
VHEASPKALESHVHDSSPVRGQAESAAAGEPRSMGTRGEVRIVSLPLSGTHVCTCVRGLREQPAPGDRASRAAQSQGAA